MSSPALTWLVARREITDRLGSKPFIITTVISLVVIILLVIAPSVAADLFGASQPSHLRLGVTAETDLPATFADSAATTAPTFGYEDVDLVELDDRAAAEQAISDDDVDAAILAGDRVLVAEPGTDLDEFLAQSLKAANLTAFLGDAGVNPAELQTASALPDVEVVTLSGQDAAQREVQFGIGFVVTLLLFLTLQINGASVLTTTVEEKSSRIVEVLLGVLRPWQLLAGKLVAMTLLSIGQLLVYAAGGIGTALALGDVTLPETTWPALVTSLAMFLVGFGLFAAIYAVAGSLAGSAEEAQSAAAPIGFVSAAVYMAVIVGVVPDPNGVFARILTFVPFSAPFAVPVRAAAGMPTWEAVVAFVITAITLVGVVRLAGRLYSAAVLSGGKMTWRSAFRAEPIH